MKLIVSARYGFDRYVKINSDFINGINGRIISSDKPFMEDFFGSLPLLVTARTFFGHGIGRRRWRVQSGAGPAAGVELQLRLFPQEVSLFHLNNSELEETVWPIGSGITLYSRVEWGTPKWEPARWTDIFPFFTESTALSSAVLS